METTRNSIPARNPRNCRSVYRSTSDIIELFNSLHIASRQHEIETRNGQVFESVPILPQFLKIHSNRNFPDCVIPNDTKFKKLRLSNCPTRYSMKYISIFLIKLYSYSKSHKTIFYYNRKWIHF